MSSNVLLDLNGVSKSFRSADGAPLQVLDAVDFSLAEGEIVALLGKSGSVAPCLVNCLVACGSGWA